MSSMPSLQEPKLLSQINYALIIFMLIIFGIGLVNLYSASAIRVEDGLIFADYYKKQALFGGLSLLVMTAIMFFDYRVLKTLSIPIYIGCIILLICVFFFGKTVNGAQRWLALGGFSFQPSEIAKFAVLIMGARVLSAYNSSLGWFQLILVGTLGLIPAYLVFVQPDLGTAITIVSLLGGMILFHGVKWKVLRVLLVIVPIIMPLAWFFLKDYQKQRIFTFLDPSLDPRGAGYHIIQSQIAIGSGEMTGKGFMQGTQSQLRFLPEKHSDFAIAVFGEEWGFLACLILLALFCAFLYAIYSTARDAKDRFGSCLACGVFFYFFLQILINIGMVIGLMPVVGMPLPYISYGGTSLIVNSAMVGIVLNVSMRRFVFKS